MEYLIVMGMSLLFIIPLTVIFLNQSSDFEHDIRLVQLEKVSNELLDATEEAYYLGPPTQKKLRLHFPETIDSVTVEPQGIVFNMAQGQTTTPFAVDSELPLNLTGSIESFPGLHIIVVKAENNRIVLSDLT